METMSGTGTCARGRLSIHAHPRRRRDPSPPRRRRDPAPPAAAARDPPHAGTSASAAVTRRPRWTSRSAFSMIFAASADCWRRPLEIFEEAVHGLRSRPLKGRSTARPLRRVVIPHAELDGGEHAVLVLRDVAHDMHVELAHRAMLRCCGELSARREFLAAVFCAVRAKLPTAVSNHLPWRATVRRGYVRPRFVAASTPFFRIVRCVRSRSGGRGIGRGVE